MNLHSVLLTGIAIATVAWISANAQAQTSATPSTTAMPEASSAMPKKIKHHHSHVLPNTDSTPAEKAATDRLNAQQLAPAAPSSHQTGAPQPGTVDTAPGSSDGNPPRPRPMPETPNPNPMPGTPITPGPPPQ